MKMKKSGTQTIVWAVLAICILMMCSRNYVKDTYSAFSYKNTDVQVEETEDYYIIGDSDSETGLIFYPGARVEETAYAPILMSLAEADICCVLVKMPYQLAILDADAAENVMEDFPQISRWYLGGHSLGGAMAAGFAAEHEEELTGLILLAAYPTDALQQLPVLSIYGSEDKVLNQKRYEKSITLASNLTEYVIEGGNHAQFGNYGTQDKDGVATIDKEEQWQETVDYILNFVD